MTVNKVDFYLQADSALQNLAERISALQSLRKHVDAVLPAAYRPHYEVGGSGRDVVVLIVDSGALAAKLKQQLPSILNSLRKRGLEVTAIQVGVQADLRQQHKHRQKQIALTEGALSHLHALEETLPPGSLRDAVGQMIDRHHGKVEPE